MVASVRNSARAGSRRYRPRHPRLIQQLRTSDAGSSPDRERRMTPRPMTKSLHSRPSSGARTGVGRGGPAVAQTVPPHGRCIVRRQQEQLHPTSHLSRSNIQGRMVNHQKPVRQPARVRAQGSCWQPTRLVRAWHCRTGRSSRTSSSFNLLGIKDMYDRSQALRANDPDESRRGFYYSCDPKLL